SGMTEESPAIDHRRADDGALQPGGIELGHDRSDHLHSVQLVAVDGGGEHDARTGLHAAHHRHRDVHRLRSVELADLAQNLLGSPRTDDLAADFHFFRHAAEPLRRAKRTENSTRTFAMSNPVARSKPSNPGEELISMTLGPSWDSRR